MSSLSFFIPCLSPTVTSQQKRAVRVGNGIRFFKSKKQKSADNLYFTLLAPHAPKEPLSGPLCLVVHFTLPWRKSERKANVRDYAAFPCDTRPDADNRCKQLCDVMSALRFWNDDGQISSLCIHKDYGDHPGIGINLTNALATKRDGTIASLPL